MPRLDFTNWDDMRYLGRDENGHYRFEYLPDGSIHVFTEQYFRQIGMPLPQEENYVTREAYRRGHWTRDLDYIRERAYEPVLVDVSDMRQQQLLEERERQQAMARSVEALREAFERETESSQIIESGSYVGEFRETRGRSIRERSDLSRSTIAERFRRTPRRSLSDIQREHCATYIEPLPMPYTKSMEANYSGATWEGYDLDTKEKKEYRRTVSILVYYDDKFLGVSRKTDYTNFTLPGGKVEKDESAEEAVKRELLEETGLTASYTELLDVSWYDNPENGKRERVYTYVVYNPKGRRFTRKESIARGEGVVKVCTKEELISGVFGDFNKKLFEALGI